MQPVDLIFVLAGRMERKRYGIELFRAGIAPRLVLSVGRFEVSKMPSLALNRDRELKALRDATLPDERHFWVKLDDSGVHIEKADLARWNTFGELLGLRDLLERNPAQQVMIISTDIHLRRVSMTLAGLCRDMPTKFRYCAVPASLNSPKEDDWWARSGDRRFVVSELIKLLAYRILGAMPVSLVQRILRLR